MGRLEYCLLLTVSINNGLCLFYMDRFPSLRQTKEPIQVNGGGRRICPLLDCHILDAPEQTRSPLKVNQCNDKRKTNNKSVACVSFDTARCERGCMLGYEEDENNCINSCKCNEETVFEGDILLTKMNVVKMSNSAVNKAASRLLVKKRWTKYTSGGYYKVPFTIESALSSNTTTLDQICAAMEDFEKETCIRFVCKTSSMKDFISFEMGNVGCLSHVGRKGGKQKIFLGYGCQYKDIIIHETMHAMGFWHEHTRPDRDDHVRVLFKNVMSDHKENFYKRSLDEVDSMESPYDLLSIMHYDGCDFSKNGLPTITTLGGKRVVAQTPGFSVEDLNQLNKMYRCDKEHLKKNMNKGNCFC